MKLVNRIVKQLSTLLLHCDIDTLKRLASTMEKHNQDILHQWEVPVEFDLSLPLNPDQKAELRLEVINKKL